MTLPVLAAEAVGKDEWLLVRGMLVYGLYHDIPKAAI
jgi:hypothetical protein